MRLHKLKANESTGTYLVESPVTETDILLMARQLATLRLRRGRALTSPKGYSATCRPCWPTTSMRCSHCSCSIATPGDRI